MSSVKDFGTTYDASVTVAGGPAAVSFVDQHVVTLSGTVRDAVTGKGVPYASLVGYQPGGSGYLYLNTDADGTYRTLTRTGTYTVDATAYGYRADNKSATLTVPEGADRSGGDVRIYAESWIGGQITSGGKGVDSFVHVGSVASHSSPSGVWHEQVTPGRSVTPYVAGGASTFTTYYGNTVRKPDAKKVTASLGRSVDHVDIAMVRSATISGTVVDRKGKPVRNKTVQAVNLGRAGTAKTKTDSKGRYTLGRLATGKVVVYVSGGSKSLPAYGQRTVTATQGRKVSGVKVTLSSDAVVYGRITTTGSKVTRQDVSLKDSHGEYYGTLRPDSQGWVGFAALPAGTYYVHVDGSNVRKKVTVKAHRQVSFGTITRGRQVTVKGVVRTAAGKPATSALVSVADSHGMVYATVRTNSHGSYSAKVVSGKYTVTAIASSGTDAPARVSLTVKKGKSAKKNLRLAHGATITGKVLNSHGRPAIGVRVETLDGRHATTSTAGTYTITGARAGRTTLIVWDPSYVGGYRSTTTTATAKAGKTVTARTASVH
nr:carboxypeptidase regulatory-like domain-containing protein [Cellulomonas sp. JH27-2]